MKREVKRGLGKGMGVGGRGECNRDESVAGARGLGRDVQGAGAWASASAFARQHSAWVCTLLEGVG